MSREHYSDRRRVDSREGKDRTRMKGCSSYVYNPARRENMSSSHMDQSPSHSNCSNIHMGSEKELTLRGNGSCMDGISLEKMNSRMSRESRNVYTVDRVPRLSQDMRKAVPPVDERGSGSLHGDQASYAHSDGECHNKREQTLMVHRNGRQYSGELRKGEGKGKGEMSSSRMGQVETGSHSSRERVIHGMNTNNEKEREEKSAGNVSASKVSLASVASQESKVSSASSQLSQGSKVSSSREASKGHRAKLMSESRRNMVSNAAEQERNVAKIGSSTSEQVCANLYYIKRGNNIRSEMRNKITGMNSIRFNSYNDFIYGNEGNKMGEFSNHIMEPVKRKMSSASSSTLNNLSSLFAIDSFRMNSMGKRERV